MALPLRYRLKRELDFKNILKAGRTVRGDFLFLKFAPSSPVPRFGISVSAKISKKATERNRIRRILNETIRLHVLPKVTGYDTVVVVTKNGLYDSAQMEKDLIGAFQRAGLI